ncbi:unnamed protein product [Phyllotreta striolata]|uniref:Aminopeptidase P N-terminal domain-containing protein n=1 Tax=Phyllotreta striolata TaxID=444603 RepID=A0A9N9TE77_PHYSR|nr:unnamed protein product [Phyllotreta striolata]
MLKLYRKLERTRQICTRAKSTLTSKSTIKATSERILGQPTGDSHPHLLNEGEVTQLLNKREYENRRIKLAESVAEYSIKNGLKSKNHMIVIPAATTQYMSGKIPYVFRQNTEFLYLTGCLEPDCCFVMTTNGNSDFSTTVFTRNRDPHAEMWDGPRTRPDDVREFFGIDRGLPISELEDFIGAYFRRASEVNIWYDYLTPIQNKVHSIVQKLMGDSLNKAWENPKPLIQRLRLIKSPSEAALMQKTCDIASEALVHTMGASRPGVLESELYAKFEYECKMKGAQFLAYPPVIAGGSRSTIIHYVNNNQVVNDEEILLMDGGCEYHGYSSDITRTWPINGKFTAEQRELYQVVYEINEDLIEACREFPKLDHLFEKMCYLLGTKLQSLGLVSKNQSDADLMKTAYQLCPHHVSHYLGMDVHDTPTVNRNIQIKPGMVVTIEPGIYISKNNTLFPEKYRGIGIRIEDDVLITENGPIVLTKNCPKYIEDVEKISNKNA